MAVWSEVRLVDLTSDLRLDADYYHPEVLALRTRIDRSAYTVSRLEDLSSAIINFGAYSLCNEIRFQETGIPFITAENILEGHIDFSSVRFIPRDQHEGLLWKSKVSQGQVLIAMAARLGYAAVYDKPDPLNSSQDIAKVTLADPKATNPYYIAAFINSELGRTQLLASRTGSVQQHTNLGRIKNLKVVVPPPTLQGQVANTFQKALAQRERAADLYAEAQMLLLREIGLDSLDLSPAFFYERSYSETVQVHRLDAEYYQPRFQQAFTVLKAQGKTIARVAALRRERFRPKTGRPFKYIEIGDLTREGHIESNTLMGEEAPSRATWVVHTGDVITSTVRPIRRLSALIGKKEDGYICSSGFDVLQPKTVAPELLLVYLRLPIIAEILDLQTSASMYPAISTSDLMALPFKAPPDRALDKVRTLVAQSQQAWQDLERLLEEAQQSVEEVVATGGR